MITEQVTTTELKQLLTALGDRMSLEQRRHMLGFLHLSQDRPLTIHLDVKRDGRVSLFLTTEDKPGSARADH